MERQSVAVLYICTGIYTVFWEQFYKSAQLHLLPGYDKHYFVFTDKKEIFNSHHPHVHLFFQKPLQWPYPTLLRFQFFKNIEDQLKKFDYVYFFNANCRILKDITAQDILPLNGEAIVVTQHPGFWDKSNTEFTYERNPGSAAFVPVGKGNIYVAGGLNGGQADKYLSFINTCFNNVQADLEKGIIAVWHDESYLNEYILDKRVKVLHPGYLYPAGKQLPFEKIIHLENKKDFIKGYGKYSLRYKLKKMFSPKR